MGTTADKLQRLVEGKQAIVNAVNSKANTSLTINSKLSDVASAISNISGSGANTSDATAVADDILKGKTAYTANGKVEGTIETYNGESVGGAEKQQNVLQKQIDTNSAYGLFACWGFNINLDEYINSLDFSGTHIADYMFYNCQNLASIPFFNTSNITEMSYMFYGCYALTTIPQLDTSKVTNMIYMFYNCFALTSIPQLDTNKVTSMSYMFRSCSELTSIPQLDTNKVTSMIYMFYGCSKLTTIDITYYNISSTTNATYFVRDCTALKSLIIRSFGANYVLNSNSLTNSGIASRTGYVYVPRNMVDTLKSATNWSTYASQIRALEDYTVDGTTTGALDESKI